MKLVDRLNYIQENHFGAWLAERQKVSFELSDQQSVFCVCGRLATGFHESGCRRFNNKVDSETIKRLGHLLPETKV